MFLVDLFNNILMIIYELYLKLKKIYHNTIININTITVSSYCHYHQHWHRFTINFDSLSLIS